MKKILLVTPFFAPQSHAAVFRMFKLAKYLPEMGYRPVILTTDTNYNHKEDPSLLEELPGNVEIHRARYVEPTIRGLRMAVGGRPRTYVDVGTSEVQFVKDKGVKSERPLLQRGYRWLLDHELYNPDPYWTWVRPALKLGEKLVREQNIKVCLTSMYPYSSNLIGMGLKKTGCKWVADFRDPLIYCHRGTSDIEQVYLKQKRIIDDTFSHADAITGLSSCYRLIYSELYPERQRVQFIPTGLDEALLPESKSEPKKNHILFTGEYLPSYDGRFFEIFQKALKAGKIPQDAKIRIVGYRDINLPRLASTIERWNLSEHVEFVDHMPQKELYKLIDGCRAGLLNTGEGTTWWTNFAKMVDFIAMKKPMVASVSDPSEARTELTKAGLGIFLDGPLESDIEKLQSLFSDTPIPVNESYCQRYLAHNMVSEFTHILESL